MILTIEVHEMESICVSKVDALVVEFVVTDLKTSQRLSHDRLVKNVSCNALDYLTVFFFGESCFNAWKVVDVEDRLRSFAEVFGRRKAFLSVNMTWLLGEGLEQNNLLLDTDKRSIWRRF